jgi:hypothetical protein
MCLLTLPLSSLTFLFTIHRKDWSENRPQHLHQGYHSPLSHFFILGDPLTHLRSVVFAVVDASSHLHHHHQASTLVAATPRTTPTRAAVSLRCCSRPVLNRCLSAPRLCCPHLCFHALLFPQKTNRDLQARGDQSSRTRSLFLSALQLVQRRVRVRRVVSCRTRVLFL